MVLQFYSKSSQYSVTCEGQPKLIYFQGIYFQNMLPVASSDSVVESHLSIAFLGCFLVLVLSRVCDKLALRTDLCKPPGLTPGVVATDGFGKERGSWDITPWGRRPLRAFTAAAA